jgi:hypothetical protein
MNTYKMRVDLSYALLFVCCSLLTGCALEPTAARGPQPGAAISGKVFGGQQPIIGAKVYLLAADETGYGNASESLLEAALTGHQGDSIGSYVLTKADGSFALSSSLAGVPEYDYTCPTFSTQVYVYVAGGDSGNGGTNSHIGLMAALGSCGNLADSTYIDVNEVTTVAAAYALSGFALDATDIASSASALSITGLQNAFLNATQLADLGTGAALLTTPNGNGTVDRQQIYTLANILAACINTGGTEAGPTSPTACYTLLHHATTGGSSPIIPSETATAAINIAHHPATDVATLAALSTPTSPFPQASATPNDFTVGISYDLSSLNTEGNPGGGALAIDAEDNVWVAYTGSFLAKLSSTGVVAPGVPFTGGGKLVFPVGLAVDQRGSVWVANFSEPSSGLIRFTRDGSTAVAVTGGTSPVILAQNVAIDAGGDVWADNYTGSGGFGLTDIKSPGFTTSSSYYAGLNSSDSFTGIAFDDSGNLWATQIPGVVELRQFDGSPYPGSPYPLLDGTTGDAIAVDASGAIWIAGASGDSGGVPDIVKSTGSGASYAQAEYNGGGLGQASGLAIDGAGNVWVANSDGVLSEFSNAGVALSPTGFTGGQVEEPTGIAVDGSGDVWAVNFTNGTFSDVGPTTMTELIGAAVPVVTPIAAGLIIPYTPGSKP